MTQETFDNPGMQTATELFDLYQLFRNSYERKILPINRRFNFMAKLGFELKGWLHLGPEGIVTDEVYTVNYKPYAHGDGIFSSERYQMVKFRQDNGQPLIDRNSRYIKQSLYLGNIFSPTGVYEGNRRVVGGGSMQPVLDTTRANEIIDLMRARIHIAHQTHCRAKHMPKASTPRLIQP